VSALETVSDPLELGLDPDRLAAIPRHFERYLEAKKLPGFSVLVSRAGEVAHFSMAGYRDVASAAPVTEETVFRIYSMTKPITSVALMMLYEEGLFDLSDPVADYLPEFANPEVLIGGSALKPVLRPATEPIRVWHLLTHTSGMTYGWFHANAVDALYRSAGFEWGVPEGADLAECCQTWARLPLLFDPGTAWNYSHSTDVIGRLVELLSQKSLEAFFAERIFGPLGMGETGFFATPAQQDRLATLYLPDAFSGEAVPSERMGRPAAKPPRAFLGGSGLVSTIGDYYRFTRCLLEGGQLNGVRLLGPRTLSYMTENHLPGGHDMAHFGNPITAEAEFGVGFGLGFSVVIDPASMKVPASVGEFAWGGAASTAFWVDRREEMIVIFMTQLLPSTTYPIRRELRRLVYQSIVA
jgi:CubicO group peptidase (beta-lactamase class C family)